MTKLSAAWKKRQRIDAPRAWGTVYEPSGELDDRAWNAPEKNLRRIKVDTGFRIWYVRPIRVRILRESDYRRLLKEARRER